MMAKLDTVSVSYQGKDYMIARIPDVFTNTRNNIFIGPHSLSHALYDNHIGYADEDARSILSFAQKLENPYDLAIEWRLLNAKKHGLFSPVITGTETYLAGKLRRGPHAEEAFGYTFEKTVLFAASLGVGTTWIAGTMDRGAFERAMEVSEEEVLPCVSPLGYPAKKMSLRETMMRKGVKADSRLPFEALFFDGSFHTPLTGERAGALERPLEAVRLGPSAVNHQPWRAVRIGDAVHFYEKPGKGMGSDGWDVQRIDLGIALSHFELAAVECGFHPVFRLEDPGIPTEGAIYIASYVLAAQPRE